MPATSPDVYGLLGFPLGHTLSPLIHGAALRATGQPGAYVALPVPPERLGEAIAGVRAFRFPGLNVTIPHKVAIIPYLDGLTDRATAIGAVNTLFWDGDRLLGDNTDFEGFAASLPAGCPGGREALVLGAGGAARAVAIALREAGASAVHVAARQPAAARALRAELLSGVPGKALALDDVLCVAARCGVVVNATPLGTHGEGQPLDPLALAALSADAWVLDLVYRPAETPLMRLARARGLRAITSRIKRGFAEGA
jgi:shikimate dehydrogenase